MNKSQQALELIAMHGITAKEAARSVGISPAAVSKAKLHQIIFVMYLMKQILLLKLNNH